jgi:hypothetical protein
MNNPALPHNTTASASAGASKARQNAAKNLPRFMLHNPLISLDSGETIQGNPRQSNPHKQAYLQRNGDQPRKPKG